MANQAEVVNDGEGDPEVNHDNRSGDSGPKAENDEQCANDFRQ